MGDEILPLLPFRAERVGVRGFSFFVMPGAGRLAGARVSTTFAVKQRKKTWILGTAAAHGGRPKKESLAPVCGGEGRVRGCSCRTRLRLMNTLTPALSRKRERVKTSS